MSRISASLAIYLLVIFAVLHTRPACCFDAHGDLLPVSQCKMPLVTICVAAGVLSYFVGVSASTLKINVGKK